MPFRPFLAALALGPLTAAEVPQPAAIDPSGRLVSQSENPIPDYSHAGHAGGGAALPMATARAIVKPGGGDDTQRIQAAIDHVSQLPPDASGIRGAVVLDAGSFEVAGQLRILTNGVVLRGSGNDSDGTTIIATGTGRRSLIVIGSRTVSRGTLMPVALADASIPRSATTLHLEGDPEISPGSRLTIRRPGTAEWIRRIGMHEAPGRSGHAWKPGTIDLEWDRTVVVADGATVTLDAPVTTSIEHAAVVRHDDARIARCGVENLRCVARTDPANPLDENHAWDAIQLRGVRDAWVADVTAEHFAGAAVRVTRDARRVTVQDCHSLDPISEIAGGRRTAFRCDGQQALFLRCVSENGRNDFTTGALAAGPNVFLDCEARGSAGFSGSAGSWASGVLFDGVTIDGGTLRLDNLEIFQQGAGWAAADSMLWNCTASRIICRSPDGAPNLAVGVWGQLAGDGRWSETHRFVRPKSIYRAQLAARLGSAATEALRPRSYPAPTPGLPRIPVPEVAEDPPAPPLAVTAGMLTIGGNPIHGKPMETAWWRGRIEPTRARGNGPALTRFVPGVAGRGFTDDPSELVDEMKRGGSVIFRHHPGLWYDRRRDDHQMTRRPDADVWPPFFEQPFARCGRGTAWDGLSRYDLTRFNPWYFDRLLGFAREARRGNVVLFNEMYFQHNVLESGAHWVDSPWRPANHVNDTGFTEPPPFDGDTIRMAAEFYDISHPVRRELHRNYIRHHLDMLGGEPNVIHSLTAENSGPLEFMRFWIDVIAEWKAETGRHPLIALSAPKDVQDAVLADSARAAVVDVIDLRYWFRTADGDEFAPPGGTDLAPRQHLRKWKHGRPSAGSIAAMAAEYRLRFPDKAVISFLPEAADIQP